MRKVFVSHSESQTSMIAEDLAGALRAGDIVFLKGPLGAGKTCFVRAASRRLGITAPVTSPSFTLARSYDGSVPVSHLDLYRLEGYDSHEDAELEPYISDDRISFIEWPEPVEDFIEASVTVIIEHLDRDSRRITIESDKAKLSGLGDRDAYAGT